MAAARENILGKGLSHRVGRHPFRPAGRGGGGLQNPVRLHPRNGPILPASARKKEVVRGRLRTLESLIEIGLEGGPELGIQGHRSASDSAALNPMTALEPLAGKGDFGPDAGQVPYVPDPDGEQFRNAESRQPAEEKEHLVASPVEGTKELDFLIGQEGARGGHTRVDKAPASRAASKDQCLAKRVPTDAQGVEPPFANDHMIE
jgi:hypothetical protein